MRLGGEHDRLHGHADGTLGLVALEPLAALVEGAHPVDEQVGNFLAGAFCQ
jgi:hypothetical protein